MWLNASFLIALLIVICSVGSFEGPMESCAISRGAGILLASLVAPLAIVNACFTIMRYERLNGPEIREGRSTYGLILILLITTWLLLRVVCLFGHCVLHKDQREFWAENRTVEVGSLTIPTTDYVSELRARVNYGEARVPGIEVPVLTKFPQYCLGSANIGEPGDLWIRIIDPSTGVILVKSKKVAAKWSSNPDEKFPYMVPCAFWRGRHSKYYRVRCEVWATVGRDGMDKMIDSKDVITNGAY